MVAAILADDMETSNLSFTCEPQVENKEKNNVIDTELYNKYTFMYKTKWKGP